MYKKIGFVALLAMLSTAIYAQERLSLDSCRALALRNNKQLNIAKIKKEITQDVRKSARTKFLPKVDAVAGYEFFNKEISLLNNQQKASLSNLGTNLSINIGSNVGSLLTNLAQQGVISAQTAQQVGTMAQQMVQPLAQFGNQIGQDIKDAFRTDTRHIWSGAVMVRQPVYVGGAIVAANRIASISESLAQHNIEAERQTTIYNVDQTYWLVVSLKHKQKLANSYLQLVRKLDEDVHKMIREGVATRANGLKVDVKVNEAEMQVMQVDNGLSLAKMLLCQICGLAPETPIMLDDEEKDQLSVNERTALPSNEVAFEQRPELQMLQNTIDISKQTTKIIRAAYLPQVALTGGYIISNPNVFNGFQRKFSGVWNVGVLVRVPLWNWFDGVYKTRASRSATRIAMMELDEAREKIDLQITQSRYKLSEAHKKLAMASQNVLNAEENLRCANVGFKEGVMESTDVMAAQTAWQQAQSLKIDAEIEVKLAQVNLQKALGILE